MVTGVSTDIVKFDKINDPKLIRYYCTGNLLTNKQFENNIYRSQTTETRRHKKRNVKFKFLSKRNVPFAEKIVCATVKGHRFLETTIVKNNCKNDSE